jgi:hypothetical protein
LFFWPSYPTISPNWWMPKIRHIYSKLSPEETENVFSDRAIPYSNHDFTPSLIPFVSWGQPERCRAYLRQCPVMIGLIRAGGTPRLLSLPVSLPPSIICSWYVIVSPETAIISLPSRAGRCRKRVICLIMAVGRRERIYFDCVPVVGNVVNETWAARLANPTAKCVYQTHDDANDSIWLPPFCILIHVGSNTIVLSH